MEKDSKLEEMSLNPNNQSARVNMIKAIAEQIYEDEIKRTQKVRLIICQLVLPILLFVQCLIVIITYKQKPQMYPKNLYLFAVSGLTMSLCQILMFIILSKYNLTSIIMLFNYKGIFAFAEATYMLGISFYSLKFSILQSGIYGIIAFVIYSILHYRYEVLCIRDYID